MLIQNRDELIYLLTEAAEVEHGLMCTYLYARWSLKDRTEEGLSAQELEEVAGWRNAIGAIALDEMTHLTLVNNLLLAIGAAPHFQRPNFPISPGYFPAQLAMQLAPFDAAAIDHFVFVERPENSSDADAAPYAPRTLYRRSLDAPQLMPQAQDYTTVGELYRSIRAGLVELAGRLGERELFCGAPRAQLGPDLAPLPGNRLITDLASAHAALDTIVAQGEGSTEDSEHSHYRRFVKIRDEFRAARARRADFEPARPAARNPVMRPPPEPDGKVHIKNPDTRKLLDVGNAAYALMLRCLDRAYGEREDGASEKRILADASFDLMHVMRLAGEQLTLLPANDAFPGVNAGLTFTLSRTRNDFGSQTAAWLYFEERVREMLEVARQTAFPRADAGSALTGRLQGLAERFQQARSAVVSQATAAIPEPKAAARSTAPVAPVAPAARPAAEPDQAAPPAEAEIAKGAAITVRFETKRCIHARHCVLGEPTVYRANTPGEWIFPDTVSAERVAFTARSCPSGAITYERHDGAANEAAPPVNTARIRENGPLAINAELRIAGPGGELRAFRATLCRCGASKNKPFCDGTHNEIAFTASGEPPTLPSDPLPARGGALNVEPLPDGPLALSGPLEICAGTGRTVLRTESTRLCRCGGSNNKPFCDGSHLRIGFRAPGAGA